MEFNSNTDLYTTFKLNVYVFWGKFYNLYSFKKSPFNGKDTIESNPHIINELGFSYKGYDVFGNYLFQVIDEKNGC